MGALRLNFVWSKNMNMISTGAFLNEMDASDKQKALVKKLTAAWEKKNAKAAKAGGASLLALSLAACGSSSEEVDITSDNAQVAADAFAEGAASVDVTSNDAAVIAEATADLDTVGRFANPTAVSSTFDEQDILSAQRQTTHYRTIHQLRQMLF